MKKRILSMILAVVLVAAMLPRTAHAASSNPFTDVPAGEYYAAAVAWAVEEGITTGTSATTFSPAQTCTQGQILTFIYRMMGSPAVSDNNPYSSGEVKPDQYFYKPMLWAYQNGIVTDTANEPNSPCTRSDVVTYLWRAEGKPSADAAAFTDVPSSADYAPAVAWAVSAKITTGTSATTFSPDSIVTRAQIVTFLHRDRVPSAAQAPSEPSGTVPATVTSYEELITGNTQLISWHEDDDAEAAEQNVRYMLQHGLSTIEMTGHATTSGGIGGDSSSYVDIYANAIMHYVEFGYNTTDAYRYASSISDPSPSRDWDMPTIKVKEDSGFKIIVTITFSNFSFDDATLKRYQQDALAAAIAVHDQLWREGKITSDMSEKEKAKVYFNWIVVNCEYDFDDLNGKFNPFSHIGYGALSLGKAVCQGYTSAYNLLLKLEGISCSTQEAYFKGDPHIWTTATLDGTFCHIDATFGDQNNVPADQYFAMTPEASWARFN